MSAIYYGVTQQSDNLTLQAGQNNGAPTSNPTLLLQNGGWIEILDQGPGGGQSGNLFSLGELQLFLPDPVGPHWRKGQPWVLYGDNFGVERGTSALVSAPTYYFSDALKWDMVHRGAAASGACVLLGIGGLASQTRSTVAISDTGVGVGIHTPGSYGQPAASNTAPVFEIHNAGSGSQPGLILSSDATGNNQVMGIVNFVSSATAQADKRVALILAQTKASTATTTTAELQFFTSNAATAALSFTIGKSGHLLHSRDATTQGALQMGVSSQSITGDDTRGTVTVTTGLTPPTAGAAVSIVNFSTAYAATPTVVLTPGGMSATVDAWFGHATEGTGAFTIIAGPNLTASQTYKIDYFAIGST